MKFTSIFPRCSRFYQKKKGTRSFSFSEPQPILFKLVFFIIKGLKNFKDLTPPYHCLKRCAESTQLRPQLQRHAIGHRVEQRIELLTVIHLSGMRQLVKQHVVHQMWRQQHQVARQVDCACACATSPFRPRSSDTHFLVGQTMHRGKFGEQWRQKLLRPAFHCPDNGCRQQLLHFRTAELSVGRAKHRCLVVVKPHREKLPCARGDTQFEARRIDCEIKVNQPRTQLLASFTKRLPMRLYGFEDRGKRRVGRHRHVQPVVLRTHCDVARAPIGAYLYTSEIGVLNNSLSRHIHKCLQPQLHFAWHRHAPHAPAPVCGVKAHRHG